jgi:hypothetical protein
VVSANTLADVGQLFAADDSSMGLVLIRLLSVVIDAGDSVTCPISAAPADALKVLHDLYGALRLGGEHEGDKAASSRA